MLYGTVGGMGNYILVLTVTAFECEESHEVCFVMIVDVLNDVLFYDRQTTSQMKSMNALYVDFLLEMLHLLNPFVWNLELQMMAFRVCVISAFEVKLWAIEW